MLKKWLTVALVPAFLVVAVVGCQQTSDTGPGGKKLTLTKPADQTIRQGETNQVRVAINRDNFRDAVNVRFENLPEGVKLMDNDTKIAASDNSANFTLKAEENAPVGEHLAKVTVEGPNGMKVTDTFKITVKERK